MSWQDPLDIEDDEDGYFAETLDDAELTGNEPRFIRIESMNLMPAQLDELKVDELIAMYIAARNQLATDRKGYKSREESVKNHMRTISAVLMNRADSLGGVDSFATDKGTAFRKTKETFRISDWHELTKYVVSTGNFSILQKRVSPNAVKEVREQDGSLPNGIEPHVEVEFAVRSPSASRKAKST